MNVATRKIFTSRERPRKARQPQLSASPLEGERIEVRGFQFKRVQMRTLTLTLSLKKGEAN